MTINKIVEKDTITVMLEGWLDVETTSQLSTYMKNLEKTQNLIFDFEKLEYVSSSGVREVVAAYKRQNEISGTFKLVHVNAEVMDVFHMTGLTKKLDISGE